MLSWRPLLSAVLLAAIPAASLRGAPPPRLLDVWAQEVFEGLIDPAARDYQSIYLSPPPSAPGVEQRRQAALRAGLCFERLGQATSARAAFLAATEGSDGAPPGSRPVLEAAILGWRRLGPQVEPLEARLPPAAAAADDSAVAAAAAEATLTLERTIAGRAASTASLEKAAAALAARRAEREAIVGRLGIQGVVLSFPEPPVLDVELARSVAQAVQAVEAQDGEQHKLVSWLTGHFEEAALAALVASNPTRAASELRCLAAVRGDALRSQGSSPPPRDWVWSLCEVRAPEVAAALASRGLQQERWRRSTALRREIAQQLAAGLEAIEHGPRHRAIGSLDKLRDGLDWAAPSWLDDPEVLAMEAQGQRARLLLLKGLAAGQSAAGRWRAARAGLERLKATAASHIRGIVEESRFARPAAVAGRRAAGEVCGLEIDRLLDAARDAVRRGDAHASSRALREAAWIVARVPEADAGRERRQAIEMLNMSTTVPPRMEQEGPPK